MQSLRQMPRLNFIPTGTSPNVRKFEDAMIRMRRC